MLTYSLFLQDFVRHFHVLLPRGTSPTKSGIREFFRRIHRPPARYKVRNTRRIDMLRRGFRAVLERKPFVRMQRAACSIQQWSKGCLPKRSTVALNMEEGAAVCLQAAWRGYMERKRFLRQKHSAMIIQRSWRSYRQRRSLAGHLARLSKQERRVSHPVKEAPSPVLHTTPPSTSNPVFSAPTRKLHFSNRMRRKMEFCSKTKHSEKKQTSRSETGETPVCRSACHRNFFSEMISKCSKKYDPERSSHQIGVELSLLTIEEREVPELVEKLLNHIEMHGLNTYGIYRKSGSSRQIKELRQRLDADVSTVNLVDYNIHVIASVLKQWLRDLPCPLMTFELYEEFIRAMGETDKQEMIRGVYAVIEQLNMTHLSTLDHLILHLVRIALQEDTNMMSANALAIVFAPCILHGPDTTDPLQSFQDIKKTTACVELIINDQMSKYKAGLEDISSLEFNEIEWPITD